MAGRVPPPAAPPLYTPCTPQNPKILLLNIELELKSEKENAEVRLDDPAQYQSIVDAGVHCGLLMGSWAVGGWGTAGLGGAVGVWLLGHAWLGWEGLLPYVLVSRSRRVGL